MNKSSHPENRRRGTPSTPQRHHRPITVDAAPTGPVQPNMPAPITPDTRRASVAEAAYYRAERRGFAPGMETEDWLGAERDIEHLLPLSGPSLVE